MQEAIIGASAEEKEADPTIQSNHYLPRSKSEIVSARPSPNPTLQREKYGKMGHVGQEYESIHKPSIHSTESRKSNRRKYSKYSK